MARNSILDQYGKVLPRVHRKLAIERAKPYRVSTLSIIRTGKISFKLEIILNDYLLQPLLSYILAHFCFE